MRMLKGCFAVKILAYRYMHRPQPQHDKVWLLFLLLRKAATSRKRTAQWLPCLLQASRVAVQLLPPSNAELTDHVKHLKRNSPMKMEGA